MLDFDNVAEEPQEDSKYIEAIQRATQVVSAGLDATAGSTLRDGIMAHLAALFLTKVDQQPNQVCEHLSDPLLQDNQWTGRCGVTGLRCVDLAIALQIPQKCLHWHMAKFTSKKG